MHSAPDARRAEAVAVAMREGDSAVADAAKVKAKVAEREADSVDVTVVKAVESVEAMTGAEAVKSAVNAADSVDAEETMSIKNALTAKVKKVARENLDVNRTIIIVNRLIIVASMMSWAPSLPSAKRRRSRVYSRAVSYD